MSQLRTLLSALSIVLGAVLIAAWAGAQAVVALVENGTAARAATENALESPELMNALTDELGERAEVALREQGIDLALLGLQGPVNQLIASAVDSEVFRSALLAQVDHAHEQFSAQLTDTDRPPSDLSISVDVSGSINAQLNDLGGLVALVPDLDVPAVSVTVMEADRFERARDAYRGLQWVQTWSGWLGIATLGFGFLVSARRRWFAAKALAAVAVIAWGSVASLTVMGPDALARSLPGGDSGVWAGIWRDVVGSQTVDTLVGQAVLVGAVATIAALIALALGVALGRRTSPGG